MSFCCNYANVPLYQNIVKLLIIYIMLLQKINHARTARCFIHKEKKGLEKKLVSVGENYCIYLQVASRSNI